MQQQHTVRLSLLNGNQVTSSPKTLKASLGDTIAFVSKDGEVNITFEPPQFVEVDPRLGFQRVTVKNAPFVFNCKLKTPNGKEVGWEGAGGTVEPNPPH